MLCSSAPATQGQVLDNQVLLYSSPTRFKLPDPKPLIGLYLFLFTETTMEARHSVPTLASQKVSTKAFPAQ